MDSDNSALNSGLCRISWNYDWIPINEFPYENMTYSEINQIELWIDFMTLSKCFFQDGQFITHPKGRMNPIFCRPLASRPKANALHQLSSKRQYAAAMLLLLMRLVAVYNRAKRVWGPFWAHDAYHWRRDLLSPHVKNEGNYKKVEWLWQRENFGAVN